MAAPWDIRLWEKHRIEDVATPEAWDANPELIQKGATAGVKELKRILGV